MNQVTKQFKDSSGSDSDDGGVNRATRKAIDESNVTLKSNRVIGEHAQFEQREVEERDALRKQKTTDRKKKDL